MISYNDLVIVSSIDSKHLILNDIT